jgi:hypothetical protein
MVVLITNVTDAPGKNPAQVDIYNKTLAPGAQIKIPADLVTTKLRSLETRGLIVIGNLPPWYLTAKRRSKPLSEAERQKRQVKPVPPPLPQPVLNKGPEKKDKKQEVVEEPTIKRG